MDPADVAVHDSIAKRGEQMLPSYKYLETSTGLYQVYGGEGEWFYAMQGVFTFVNELFPRFNFFRKPADGVDGREEVQLFDKYLLFGEGTVPWHEVNHPQFGKIEVGGLKKNWVRQPPSFLLEEECHRNMAFTLYHADQMPQVEIQSATARKVAGGLVEVTAVLVNRKLTPTHAAVDVRNKITSPDLVTIEGKDLKAVFGLTADDGFFLNAAEQKRRPNEMRIPTIPAMGAVHVRWLVRGDGPYTVRVRSAKGGSDRREVP
jgi:hypothetical protein